MLHLRRKWDCCAEKDDLYSRREQRMDLVGPAHDLVEKLLGINICALRHRLRNRANLEVEAGHDAEVPRTRAACRPQQLRVLRFVRPDQPAVGGHHVDCLDALAGPAPPPAVPAHAALKQEASKADGRAVSAGEHEPVLSQQRVEFVASHRGADPHGRRVRVEGNLPHAGEVDEECIVPHAPGSPAVPSGSHGNLQPALVCQAHPRDDVILVYGLEDGSGITVGLAPVEDSSNPLLLVAVISAPIQLALECGHRRHLPSNAMTPPVHRTNWASEVVGIIIPTSFP